MNRMYQTRSIRIRMLFYCILIIITGTKSANAQSSDPKLIYKAALKYFKTDTALSNNAGLPLKTLRFAVHPQTIKTEYHSTVSNQLLFSPKADSIIKSLETLDAESNKGFKPIGVPFKQAPRNCTYAVYLSSIRNNLLYAELKHGNEGSLNFDMGTVFCYRIVLKDIRIDEMFKGTYHLN